METFQSYQDFIEASYSCIVDENPPIEVLGFDQADWEKIDRILLFYFKNKNLIAAAPDLLEACKLCLYSDDESVWVPAMRKAIGKAIYKAEGENL